ncbi:hypothetical protein RB195_001773 [Necator americanus]|uniref:Uncharacterized protein n=1 Tax=Necator americanus TaxID=51031 RepID=A0ABR1DFU4_NECAM
MPHSRSTERTYPNAPATFIWVGTERDERPGLRAGQEKTSGLGSVQEHRGCSEEDQEHPAPCSPLQHHRTSFFDLCFANLGISQAGRSSLLRQRSKIRDAAAFAKENKIRWAGHAMRFNDYRWTRAVSDWVPRDIKRTTGRPAT